MAAVKLPEHHVWLRPHCLLPTAAAAGCCNLCRAASATSVSPAPAPPSPPFCAPSKNQQKHYVFQQMGTHAPGNRPQSAGLELGNSGQPPPVSVSFKIRFGRSPVRIKT